MSARIELICLTCKKPLYQHDRRLLKTGICKLKVRYD